MNFVYLISQHFWTLLVCFSKKIPCRTWRHLQNLTEMGIILLLYIINFQLIYWILQLLEWFPMALLLIISAWIVDILKIHIHIWRRCFEGVFRCAIFVYVTTVAAVSTLCLKKIRTPVIISNNFNKSGPILITFGRENH